MTYCSRQSLFVIPYPLSIKSQPFQLLILNILDGRRGSCDSRRVETVARVAVERHTVAEGENRWCVGFLRPRGSRLQIELRKIVFVFRSGQQCRGMMRRGDAGSGQEIRLRRSARRLRRSATLANLIKNVGRHSQYQRGDRGYKDDGRENG